MVFLRGWILQNQRGSPPPFRIVDPCFGFSFSFCRFYADGRSCIHAHKSQRSLKEDATSFNHAIL